MRLKPADYAGIAVLRLPTKPSQDDVLGLCRTLIAALTGEAIEGKLWSVQRGRIREYRPDATEDEPGDA